MNQIDQIKELQRQGYGAKEIAVRLGIDRKTTAKYMLIYICVQFHPRERIRGARGR